MTKKTSTIITLLTMSILLIPASAFATTPVEPNPNVDVQIDGAGASFPFPLIDLWRVEYGELYPSVQLNYQSIGSGGGVKNHISKTLIFAASDAPLKPAEREAALNTLHIPEAIGAVTVAFNRMYKSTSNMFFELIHAIEKNDLEYAEEIIQMDDEIDRFSHYLTRNLVMSLDDRNILSQLGLEKTITLFDNIMNLVSERDYVNAESFAMQIEESLDNISEMIGLTKNNENSVISKNLLYENKRILDYLLDVCEVVMNETVNSVVSHNESEVIPK